ncbi:MAG TPA: hypothetical protein VNK03_03440 [Gammaproteobacteria bacterium]|nr:hypothetical protein [Gammaproteobacteria bacterium]
MSIQLLRDEDVTQVVGGLDEATVTVVDSIRDPRDGREPITNPGDGSEPIRDHSSPVIFGFDGKPTAVNTPHGLQRIGPPDVKRAY